MEHIIKDRKTLNDKITGFGKREKTLTADRDNYLLSAMWHAYAHGDNSLVERMFRVSSAHMQSRIERYIHAVMPKSFKSDRKAGMRFALVKGFNAGLSETERSANADNQIDGMVVFSEWKAPPAPPSFDLFGKFDDIMKSATKYANNFESVKEAFDDETYAAYQAFLHYLTPIRQGLIVPIEQVEDQAEAEAAIEENKEKPKRQRAPRAETKTK